MGVSVPNLLRRLSLLFILVAVIVVFKPSTAQAAGFNVTVSPLPISLTTKPGQQVSTPLRLQNNGSEAVRLNVSLMKFKALGSNGEPQIVTADKNDASVKWVKFSETSFIAKPNVFKTVQMDIKVPKDAAFGYYYAVVFSQDVNDVVRTPNQNKFNGAVASLVLLDVQAAGEKRQLQVTSFKASKRVFQYLPASFTVTVHNPGNIHVVPTGNIFIKRSGSNNFIGTVTINEEQGNVLPESSRIFTTEWNDGFPNYQIKRQNGQIVTDKKGAPMTELNWDLKNAEKFRFGRYVASMTLVYNDGKRDIPINGEVAFWVIPWVPLFIVIGALMLMGGGVFLVGRSLWGRVAKKRQKTVT